MCNPTAKKHKSLQTFPPDEDKDSSVASAAAVDKQESDALPIVQKTIQSWSSQAYDADCRLILEHGGKKKVLNVHGATLVALSPSYFEPRILALTNKKKPLNTLNFVFHDIPVDAFGLAWDLVVGNPVKIRTMTVHDARVVFPSITSCKSPKVWICAMTCLPRAFAS